MSTQHTATGRFNVTSWTESPVCDLDGDTTEINGVAYPTRGFSRADVTYAYAGDLEGSSTVSYLIVYRPGGGPTTGFERFEGTLDGHDGSFVMQHVGEQDEQGVRMHLEVVEGMGTGALTSLRGHADVEIAGHHDDGYPLTLHYEL